MFSALFTRPLYGLAPNLKGLFPSASSILLHKRSRLHSTRRLLVMINRWSKSSTAPHIVRAVSVASIGLGAFAFVPTVHCDVNVPGTKPPSSHRPLQDTPPPVSSVSFYELTFGTVTGICAGIFVKKGAKAVAWFLGGIFVLLQYLGSVSVVRVDWRRIASKFENIFYATDKNGSKNPPTISSLWTWIIDFLTADFQPRASFLAGLALGLRIG